MTKSSLVRTSRNRHYVGKIKNGRHPLTVVVVVVIVVIIVVVLLHAREAVTGNNWRTGIGKALSVVEGFPHTARSCHGATRILEDTHVDGFSIFRAAVGTNIVRLVHVDAIVVGVVVVVVIVVIIVVLVIVIVIAIFEF